MVVDRDPPFLASVTLRARDYTHTHAHTRTLHTHTLHKHTLHNHTQHTHTHTRHTHTYAAHTRTPTLQTHAQTYTHTSHIHVTTHTHTHTYTAHTHCTNTHRQHKHTHTSHIRSCAFSECVYSHPLFSPRPHLDRIQKAHLNTLSTHKKIISLNAHLFLSEVYTGEWHTQTYLQGYRGRWYGQP